MKLIWVWISHSVPSRWEDFHKSPVVSGSDTPDAGKGDGRGHGEQPATRLESCFVGRSFLLTVRWTLFPNSVGWCSSYR